MSTEKVPVVVSDRAKSLVPGKVGITEEFYVDGRPFRVKRPKNNCWHLRDASISTYSRFGTLAEIREDVQHVLDAGRLPPPKGGRW